MINTNIVLCRCVYSCIIKDNKMVVIQISEVGITGVGTRHVICECVNSHITILLGARSPIQPITNPELLTFSQMFCSR